MDKSIYWLVGTSTSEMQTMDNVNESRQSACTHSFDGKVVDIFQLFSFQQFKRKRLAFIFTPHISNSRPR